MLILDEVLAVGDEAFQRKCNDYFMERKESGKTTILVTHDMGAVKNTAIAQFSSKMALSRLMVSPLMLLTNTVLIILN